MSFHWLSVVPYSTNFGLVPKMQNAPYSDKPFLKDSRRILSAYCTIFWLAVFHTVLTVSGNARHACAEFDGSMVAYTPHNSCSLW